MLKTDLLSDIADKKLKTAVEILSQHYPSLKSSHNGVSVEFEKIKSLNRICRISAAGTNARIEYSDLTAALRGLGRLISETKIPRKPITEETSFKTMGIMLDCSRNAVMKVEHFKSWLRKMSLMGFNMAMLYTEDTYELPGEPYFGYQRGRYTAEELRDIDTYAAKLGIEMIGCIQTLAHLEQILKWSEYARIKDTPNVLLIGDERTYELIEKMIRNFAGCFRSRRIHIGMDEAEHFGRGRYMDIHGYKRSFDLFNEHLQRVAGICRKYGLEPLIWSDMYLKLGSKNGDYYDTVCRIPKQVKAKIPKDVRLVYWDYYHKDEGFYLDRIKRHRALSGQPIMASGIWTWHSLWYDKQLTEQNAGACIQACKKTKLDEIFFAMWGDDGAYCNFDSGLAGMAYVSELAYSDKISNKILSRRFSFICGGDYESVCLASDINMHDSIFLGDRQIAHSSSSFFWDDPLLLIYFRNKSLQHHGYWTAKREHYKKLVSSLAKTARDESLKHALLLAKIFYQKIDIAIELDRAYKAGHKPMLKKLRQKISVMINLLSEINISFRNLWLKTNKPQGLEVLQIRIAGQISRYTELDTRLQEFLLKKITTIDELEQKLSKPLSKAPMRYSNIATSSSIL